MDEPLNDGPAADEGDAAGVDIVPPSGKPATDYDAASEQRKRRGAGERQGKNNKNRIATGDYGNAAGAKQRVSTPNKRRPAPAVGERRTPLQSGIFKLVEASVRYVSYR